MWDLPGPRKSSVVWDRCSMCALGVYQQPRQSPLWCEGMSILMSSLVRRHTDLNPMTSFCREDEQMELLGREEMRGMSNGAFEMHVWRVEVFYRMSGDLIRTGNEERN